MPHTLVPPLDRTTALDVGILLAGRADADERLSAAHAVHEGIARHWHMVTDRAEPLLRIDSSVLTDAIP